MEPVWLRYFMALQVVTFWLLLHIYGERRKVRARDPEFDLFLQAVAGMASLYYREQTVLGRRCQSKARIHLALELLEPEVST